MPKMYGWVREIVPESPADRAGLQSGDLIRTINGQTIRDLVDYRFYVADEELTIGFERQLNQHEVHISKTYDENLGVLFGEEPAPFIRQCANKCVFCFIKGLPERFAPQPGLAHGMRSTLYIKDDDYRYSFLFGNFITLTNLKEHDWQRLDEQKLTPLYVSVHTTDPDLRRKMVDGPRAGDIIDHIKHLGSMGITCHTQLVLCPPINEGPHLDRSIHDLTELRPTVESISVVPVGLTKYNNMIKAGDLPPLRHYRREEAEAVIEIAVRDHDPRDRRMARRARVQRRERLDLRADLRRDVEQEPRLAVAAHRERVLRAGARAHRARARAATVRAAAVPLREAAARRRAQDANHHVVPHKHDSPSATTEGLPRLSASQSLEAVVLFPTEIVLIRVDLGVHLDFHEVRGFPHHDRHLPCRGAARTCKPRQS